MEEKKDNAYAAKIAKLNAMEKKRNLAFGIISLIFGILSIVLTVYTLVAFGFTNMYRIPTLRKLRTISYSLLAVSLAISIITTVFGAISKKTTGLGTAGLVFSIIGLVLSIVGFILFLAAFTQYSNFGL